MTWSPAARQLAQGAVRDDASLAHDDNTVTEPLEEFELVAGEQDAGALLASFGEDVCHRVHADGIETGERLVD